MGSRIRVAAPSAGLPAPAACTAIDGAGRDVSAAGDAVSDTARDETRRMSA